MEQRGQFTFYRSYYEALKSLPKKEREPVLMAIIAYALDGESPALSGVGSAIFSLVKPTLDTGRKKAESGKQGGSKTKANDKQTATEKEKEGEREKEKEKEDDSPISPLCVSPPSAEPTPAPKKFRPPTVGEVLAYCRERGNAVDPGRFVDFYESKGWKVGNQPMKDWKAAVRTWERQEQSKGTGNVFFDIAREEGLM